MRAVPAILTLASLAFVALGNGRFAPRDVELGPSGEDGLVAVTSGLDEGERVVISGQFLLDAESRMQEAIQKMLAEKQNAGAPAVSDPDTRHPAPDAHVHD